MIFISTALALVLLVALILPLVLCGKKSEATVVSSAKKTEKEEAEKEETTEETDEPD